ncbi:MAG: hypothetical protein ACLQUZ_16365 [Rhizomicrobium sp.]
MKILVAATALALLSFSVQAQEPVAYDDGWEGCPSIGNELSAELKNAMTGHTHIDADFVIAWNACQKHLAVPDVDREAYEHAMKKIKAH